MALDATAPDALRNKGIHIDAGAEADIDAAVRHDKQALRWRQQRHRQAQASLDFICWELAGLRPGHEVRPGDVVLPDYFLQVYFSLGLAAAWLLTMLLHLHAHATSAHHCTVK